MICLLFINLLNFIDNHNLLSCISLPLSIIYLKKIIYIEHIYDLSIKLIFRLYYFYVISLYFLNFIDKHFLIIQ